MAIKALQEVEVKIPIISLAKKHEEVYEPGRKKPLILSKKSESLKLLMHIRDEAHRFAVTYHKLLRSKGMFKD